jgi:hypothetical protein
MDVKKDSGEALEIIAPDVKVISFNRRTAKNGSEFFVFTGMCGGVSVDFFVYDDNKELFQRSLAIDKGAHYLVVGESYPRIKATPSGENYMTIGIKVHKFRKIADREETQTITGPKKTVSGFGM